MFVTILFVIILLLLYIVTIPYLSFNRKILNPLSILLFVWIFVFILHSIYWTNVENRFYAYFILLFCLTLLITSFILGTKGKLLYRGRIYAKKYNLRYLHVLIKWFIIIDIIRLIYYYLIISQIAGSNILYFILNSNAFRYDYLHRETSFIENVFSFTCNLFSYLGYVVLGIFSAYRGKNWKIILIFITLIELAISALTTSKFAFTVYIIAFIVTYLNNVGNIKIQKSYIKKILPFIFIILFGFFFLVGYQRNYMETKDGLSTGVLNGLINYLAGPLEAFSRLLFKSDIEIGMIDIGRTETNVYTFFYPFYCHLSYFGLIFYSLLIGYISGRFYDTRYNNFFSDTANTWICVYFAMSFFDCLITHLVFIMVFILAYFINIIFKKQLYVN